MIYGNISILKTHETSLGKQKKEFEFNSEDFKSEEFFLLGNHYAGFSLTAVPFFNAYGFNVYLFPLHINIDSASYGIKQHTISVSLFDVRFCFMLSWGTPNADVLPQKIKEDKEN